MHHFGVFFLLVRQFRVQQQTGHADDAVHRSTNLVAHIGQKLALRLARGIRLVASNRQILTALPGFGFTNGELPGAFVDHVLEYFCPVVELTPVADNEPADQRKRAEQDQDDRHV